MAANLNPNQGSNFASGHSSAGTTAAQRQPYASPMQTGTSQGPHFLPETTPYRQDGSTSQGITPFNPGNQTQGHSLQPNHQNSQSIATPYGQFLGQGPTQPPAPGYSANRPIPSSHVIHSAAATPASRQQVPSSFSHGGFSSARQTPPSASKPMEIPGMSAPSSHPSVMSPAISSDDRTSFGTPSGLATVMTAGSTPHPLHAAETAPKRVKPLTPLVTGDQLAAFCGTLDQFVPTIPDEVIKYYLSRSGVDPSDDRV